jgi:hypothetical protein
MQLDGFQFYKPFATRLRPMFVLVFRQNDIPVFCRLGMLSIWMILVVLMPALASVSKALAKLQQQSKALASISKC